MTKGSGGIFDVAVDGARIFSKHEAGRFPAATEILDGIERLRKA
jgi:selT/selW/selH-like putative selenoprotein